jgi:hypothetical protein
VTLPTFPAPLPITYALRVVLASRQLREQHTVTLALETPHDEPLAEVRVTFDVASADLNRKEEAAFAAPLPLGVFQIDRPGRYLLKATFDTTVLGTFPLLIDGPAAPQSEPDASETPNSRTAHSGQ